MDNFFKPINVKQYNTSELKFKQITEKIADMIFLDLEPYKIVEKPGFCHLMSYLDPKYPIPSRKYFF